MNIMSAMRRPPHRLRGVLFAIGCSSSDTQLVGWPPSLNKGAAATSREIGTMVGVAICDDLGPLLLRQIALPIAREIYRFSPASNEVGTVSVALSGHARNRIVGSCNSRSLLRFRPEDLIPRHSATHSGHP